MKTYQIVITGVLLIAFGFLVSLSTMGQALAGQLKEVIVSNFPVLQEVLVVNTDPIDVNVVNENSGQKEFVYFFDDGTTGLSGRVESRVIDTTNYNYLWFFSFENYWITDSTPATVDLQYFSPINGWTTIYHGSARSFNKGYPVKATQYRLVILDANPAHTYVAGVYLTQQMLPEIEDFSR